MVYNYISIYYRQMNLNYVTFEPVMISKGGIIGIPLFEPMTETMKRAMRWLNSTNQGIM